MFTVSTEQFASIGRSNFTRRLSELIRTNHPEHSSDICEPEMAATIGRQLDLALGYGLEDERSAGFFVITAFLLGEGFDTRIPALAQVLGAAELTATQKAQVLEDFCRALFGALAFGVQP